MWTSCFILALLLSVDSPRKGVMLLTLWHSSNMSLYHGCTHNIILSLAFSGRLQLVGELVEGVDGVVAAGPRQVRQLIKVLLLLSHVPVQTLSQRGEPVGDLILGADWRHRVDWRRHPQAEKGERFWVNISLDETFINITFLNFYK